MIIGLCLITIVVFPRDENGNPILPTIPTTEVPSTSSPTTSTNPPITSDPSIPTEPDDGDEDEDLPLILDDELDMELYIIDAASDEDLKNTNTILFKKMGYDLNDYNYKGNAKNMLDINNDSIRQMMGNPASFMHIIDSCVTYYPDTADLLYFSVFFYFDYYYEYFDGVETKILPFVPSEIDKFNPTFEFNMYWSYLQLGDNESFYDGKEVFDLYESVNFDYNLDLVNRGIICLDFFINVDFSNVDKTRFFCDLKEVNSHGDNQVYIGYQKRYSGEVPFNENKIEMYFEKRSKKDAFLF